MLENIKQAKNWEDRYRFIIQAGKHLPQPSPDELAQMQHFFDYVLYHFLFVHRVAILLLLHLL